VFGIGRALKVCLALFVFSPIWAESQITINSPGAVGDVIAACQDYATRELNNPWDMSDPADIVTLLPQIDYDGFSSISFQSGEFVGVTSIQAPFFYLVSPPIPSSQPALGQRGFDRPIDPTRYNKLVIRMFSGSSTANQEFRILWNHGDGYHPNFSLSAIQQFFLKPGWNTYTVDLNSVVLQSEGTPRPWTSAPVTGLRLGFSAPVGTTLKVDWVSLQGGSECGSTAVEVQATPTDNAQFYNLYLDQDSDPTNGFVKQLATGESATGSKSFGVSAVGLFPRAYVVRALGSSDYATLFRGDPWDMSSADDILAISGISNGRIEGGSYRGTTTTSSVVALKFGTSEIPAAAFTKLSFKLEQSVRSDFFLYWNDGSSFFVRPTVNDADGDNIYHIDLSSLPQWTGTIRNLLINPSVSAGIHFALDFVTLEPVSFRNDIPVPSTIVAAGTLGVNTPPRVDILQPDQIGGEARYPWNMGTTSDVPLVQNLSVANILPFNSVAGLTGDFFYGVNPLNNDDPINWSRFFTLGAANIDTSKFYRLTYRLLVEGDVDIVLGSVARVYWTSDQLRTSGQSQDIIVYGGWNTYTIDMRTALTEDGSATWSGIIDSFRIDSHEFRAVRPYYFDFIHLRTDDQANGSFLISYDISDSDSPDTALTVDLSYSSSSNCSSSIPISTFTVSSRAADKGRFLWDTSGVVPGEYFVCLNVSDGRNTNRRVSTGVVTISRSFSDSDDPVMSLFAPTSATVFGDSLQIKGYALDAIQLAEVRVTIDGTLFAVLYPKTFDPAARAMYPNLVDSSNAGFNTLLDTTGIAVGPHTVLVTATDTSGNSNTQSFSLTKQAGVSPTIVPDEIPNGQPISVAQPSATPQLPVVTRITSTKKGTVTADVNRIQTGCTLSLHVSPKAGMIGTKVAERSVSSADAANGLRFSASKVPALRSPLYMRAVSVCPLTTERTSNPRSFRTNGPTRKKPSATRTITHIKRVGRFL